MGALMNISPFAKRIIIIVIGFILVLYGALELIFKINMDPVIVNRVATILLICALFILVYDRKNRIKK